MIVILEKQKLYICLFKFSMVCDSMTEKAIVTPRSLYKKMILSYPQIFFFAFVRVIKLKLSEELQNYEIFISFEQKKYA